MITADTVKPLANDLLRVVNAGQALSEMALMLATCKELPVRDRNYLRNCALEWEEALNRLRKG